MILPSPNQHWHHKIQEGYDVLVVDTALYGVELLVAFTSTYYGTSNGFFIQSLVDFVREYDPT